MKPFLVSTSLPLKLLIAISICIISLTTILTASLINQSPENVKAAEQQQKETVVSGLNQPIPFDWLPDQSMLIGEKGGRLLRFANGQTQTIANLTVSSFSERGLLGLAVDPNFTTNRQIYLYLSTTTGVNQVVRYTLTESLTLANQFILLDNIYSSSQGNHNAGDLHFDSNRNLFISTGDGGAANSCNGCSQKLDSPNGKILRINPDTGAGVADNPFINNTNSVAKKVWAYGLRNPYRFGIQPNTNLVYIADVGENRYEELNQGSAGANYGWPQIEGPSPANQAGITYPVFYYERANNLDPSFNNCSSVTGGAFTKGSNFPANYSNHYFFADYTCGKIWSADSNNPQSASLFAQNAGAPVHLAFGNDGALYYSDIASGSIKRIKYISTTTPTASPTQSPQPTQTPTPTASPSPTITPTVSPSPSTTPNTPPTLIITSPINNSKALPDDSIEVTATVSDINEPTISANNIQWTILRHHGTSHSHPWYQGTGKSLSFPMPAPEDLETAATSHLQAIATIQDSQGATTSKSVSIYFDTVNITFQTQPAGLKVVLNNLQYTTPITLPAVKGQSFSVSAPEQEFNGKSYTFASWSNNQVAQHNYTAPQTPTTLTASFSELISATPSPTPSATPTASPTIAPTTEPTITPTESPITTIQPSIAPSLSPSASPTPLASTQLILCSYQDKNSDGVRNQGEFPLSWSYTYEYNNQIKSTQSNRWKIWTHSCAKVNVPAETTISVRSQSKTGWNQTALFADGAKTDGTTYTYISEPNHPKILWFLHTKVDTNQPVPTPIATISPSPTIQPSLQPTTSPSIIPTPTETPAPLHDNIFDVSQAQITPPFKLSEQMLTQSVRTVDSFEGSGKASIMFIVPTSGTYRIRALAQAADHTSNSIFYNIDQEPGLMDIWDFAPTNYLEESVSSMRTNDQRYIEHIKEKTFTLTEGTHELIIRGREPNLKLHKISIEKVN